MCASSRLNRRDDRGDMAKEIDEILKELETLTEQEIQEVARYVRKRVPPHPLETKWNTKWELILDAIARAEDISQRGLRGLIAEAAFEAKVLPTF
jgi:hypothetical protein